VEGGAGANWERAGELTQNRERACFGAPGFETFEMNAGLLVYVEEEKQIVCGEWLHSRKFWWTLSRHRRSGALSDPM
jgi:hypothetical protein